jgi:hypothetical protein
MAERRLIIERKENPGHPYNLYRRPEGTPVRFDNFIYLIKGLLTLNPDELIVEPELKGYIGDVEADIILGVRRLILDKRELESRVSANSR